MLEESYFRWSAEQTKDMVLPHQWACEPFSWLHAFEVTLGKDMGLQGGDGLGVVVTLWERAPFDCLCWLYGCMKRFTIKPGKNKNSGIQPQEESKAIEHSW